ncbi:MAG: hypothetical protein LJE61_14065 [Thiocapsa sp.]|jgi:hypothetical protein|nr:hypothetical protein [Thiocapsa sp.]MCG6897231.1 hypothetical protein [Thiocapsa sp.]MCG6986313.1 hypothetical protein [Thiocapsa sp.]
MDALVNLLVILLFLSGFFSVLSLACAFLERVPEGSDSRPRRGRPDRDRPRRRSRVARPRRKLGPLEDDAPRQPTAVPAIHHG